MDKQIEEMTKAIHEKQEGGWVFVEGKYTTDVFNRELAEHLVVNKGYHKQTEGEWISVDDRLPECAGQYIVYTKYGDTEMDSFFILPTDKSVAYFLHHIVTHWMPLPQPPKMKGGE